ncbi:hypothetical protein [Vibrio alginolyticus]|uniref:hypothetical protein n=1 Tax=Vibrio alginolyticus TaxID=663 RepID=UPI00148CC182|nr:hypothetical protein [Vibrio alginolyticus]NOI46150.1 hypothetical protein [Vibrio alginolyticus]
MNSKELIDELRVKYNFPNNKHLSEKLGLSYATVQKWSNEPRNLTVKQVVSVIEKVSQQSVFDAHSYSIKPIVEYYPIEVAESKQGTHWELFNSDVSGNKRQENIKDYLRGCCGVYIFYDSRGEALYIGKAKEQSLWDEMKNAFNRDRQTQKIKLVSHPYTGTGFKPAFESPRKIEKTNLQLADMASYFSAYEVEDDMINNVEALLVRVFANSILNIKMEKFVE